mgnify:CR=1 FL=1
MTPRCIPPKRFSIPQRLQVFSTSEHLQVASGWKPQVVPTVTGVAGAGLILQVPRKDMKQALHSLLGVGTSHWPQLPANVTRCHSTQPRPRLLKSSTNAELDGCGYFQMEDSGLKLSLSRIICLKHTRVLISRSKSTFCTTCQSGSVVPFKTGDGAIGKGVVPTPPFSSEDGSRPDSSTKTADSSTKEDVFVNMATRPLRCSKATWCDLKGWSANMQHCSTMVTPTNLAHFDP